MPEFRIVLVEPEGEENIGYVARAMKNFGMGNLVLVKPKAAIGDKAFQRAMGGRGIIKKASVRRSIAEACANSSLVVGTTGKLGSGYSVTRTCITPREFAQHAKKLKGSVAILFGRESIGLKNEELNECDIVIRIPAGRYGILNIAHAASIVFYELFISRAKPSREQPSEREKKVLAKIFEGLVSGLSYTNEKEKIVVKVFKNLLGRSMISRREFFTLAGVFNRLKRLRK